MESMESDFQREEGAPAARPKEEPSVEENVDADSPASGVSIGRVAPEAVTEEGCRRRATLALCGDLERASWARWEEAEGRTAAGARRGRRREAVRREQEPATWLEATQPGFVYKALAIASAGSPWSKRGPKRGREAPEGGRSAPEAHRGRRPAEGHARLGAGRPSCAAHPSRHPGAPHSAPLQRTLASSSGVRRASQSTSRDGPEGVSAGNAVGHVGGPPETSLTFR